MARALGRKDSLITMLKQEQIEAAQEFANITLDALNTALGVHAETAVAGVARMAGTYLFRTFGFPMDDIQPGQVVLSDMANDQGPALIEILGGALTQIGVSLNEENLGGETSAENQPNQSFLETQVLLEPRFAVVQEQYGLTHHEAAEACVIATALLIEDCSQVLDPNVAFNIAINSFIEGTKTAP
jgi:hypothetical protein